MKRDVLTDIARNVRIAVQISWRYAGLLSYITTRLLRWLSGFKCVQCGLESGLLYLIPRNNLKKKQCILCFWVSYLWIPVRGFSFFLFCYFISSFLCHLLSLFLLFFFINTFFGILFCLNDSWFLHFYGKAVATAEQKMDGVARGREWWIVLGTNRHVVPVCRVQLGTRSVVGSHWV